MAKRGKNINLYLMDGEANLRIKCTMANWTGVAFKIPRTELDRCDDREELKNSGVYFLFGTSEETDESVVYIGQAISRKNGEGILYRLKEHRRSPEKDYWTEAVVFTTKDNSLGATEISYLENRFCNMAIDVDRYKVKNNNDPTPGNPTEEKESEMEEFIDYAKVIMGALGYKVFESLRQLREESEGEAVYEKVELHLERDIKDFGKVEANGLQIPEGIVVFKGSKISPKDDDNIPNYIIMRRKNAEVDENNILLKDERFGNPSAAAKFVIGKSENGWTKWKTVEGKTLKDLESEN